MVRYLRIGAVLVLASCGGGLLQGFLGMEGDGVGVTLVGACLAIAAVFVTALTDREFFGLD